MIEKGFDTALSAYSRTLDIVLRHQAITLGVFFATLALTVVWAFQIPKGFFPIQDTGLITAVSEAGQDVPPFKMMRLQRELGDVILNDPDVQAFASQTGKYRKYWALYDCIETVQSTQILRVGGHRATEA
jgi:HAE1 family hydrophobic/amphiphilic exporter-1